MKIAIARWLMPLALAALAACGQAEPVRQAQPIGLFTSLPILWAESDDMRAHIAGNAPAHWVRAALMRHGELRALDTLAGAGGAISLSGIGLLVMAQPRALSPQENVALDAWVRGGGRVLLFADPMLTEDSAFPLGDPRRPQGMVLLSPLFEHWKLRLEFAEDQPDGPREVDLAGDALPVNLAGRFVIAPGSGACRLLGEGVVADCRLGKGRALIVADAALLEAGRGVAGQLMFDALIARLDPRA